MLYDGRHHACLYSAHSSNRTSGSKRSAGSCKRTDPVPGVSYSLRKDQNCSEMETRKRNTWLQNLQEDKWR